MLIGLKSKALIGWATFGINMMKDCFHVSIIRETSKVKNTLNNLLVSYIPII